MGCPGSKAGEADKPPSPGTFRQTIVVLRHSERRDQVDSWYLCSKEHDEYPHDSPLTENGVKLAQEVALELKKLHERAKFHMVVSSPYRRCMHTAAEVAKELELPVLLDQEIGEIWDASMPSDKPGHRSPKELQELAEELGIQIKNPLLPEGGYKLFGKRPAKHPEKVHEGHKRTLVRVENYIMESETNKSNYILVGHAPGVGAMLDIFERGMVDVQRLGYCAMVTASRNLRMSQVDYHEDTSVFAQNWTVNTARIDTGNNCENSEKLHQDYCEETMKSMKERKKKNTMSDDELRTIMSSGLESWQLDSEESQDKVAEEQTSV